MILLIFLIFANSLAEARIYDLYRSDRRFKGAFCTAIGGACAADDDLVTGIFENPASLATGRADWDIDGDYATKSNLEPGMKDSVDRDERSAVLGASYSTGKFGLGGAFALQSDSVDSDLTVYDDSGLPKRARVHTNATLLQFRVPMAFQVSDALSLGFSVSASRHAQELLLTNSGANSDNGHSAFTVGVALGALYSYSPRLRFGSWFRLPTTLFETLTFSATSLATTINYREELALHYPWVWAFGTQWRLGDSTFLFGELDVIGPTRHAYLFSFDTLSSFVNDAALTPKGRDVALEPHVGLRTPISGDTRLHVGSYYEAPRTAGVSARVHGTAGISFSAFHLCDVIGGIDIASRYKQFIFTFR